MDDQGDNINSVLIADDDAAFRTALVDFFEDHGYTVTQTEDVAGAVREVSRQAPDVLVIDLVLPDGSGFDIVNAVPGDAGTYVVVITGHPSVETAIRSLRKSVDDYLTKPVSLEELNKCLTRIGVGSQRLSSPARNDSGERPATPEPRLLHSESAAMRELFDAMERVAELEATVFIQGESGTGKELVARELHLRSGVPGELVVINCGAVPENLIASELFGHEKGAFTGALRRHAGVFERADRGTLFLDEVTEMPVDMQVNLLRVLETGTVTRVGGDKEIPVSVRVIAATNKDPEKCVSDGTLREDLYYRLMVYPLRVPPLRERPEDIRTLAEHFLAALNQSNSTNKQFTEPVLNQLMAHSWPGNVRELKHAVQRLYINADAAIDQDTVPDDFARPIPWDGGSLELTPGMPIAEAEYRLITATLEHFSGDKKRTAEALGVSLKTIYNRLKEYQEGDGNQA